MSKFSFIKYSVFILVLIVISNAIFSMYISDQMVLLLSFDLSGQMRSEVPKKIALSIIPVIVIIVTITGVSKIEFEKILHLFILNIILIIVNYIIILFNLIVKT